MKYGKDVQAELDDFASSGDFEGDWSLIQASTGPRWGRWAPLAAAAMVLVFAAYAAIPGPEEGTDAAAPASAVPAPSPEAEPSPEVPTPEAASTAEALVPEAAAVPEVVDTPAATESTEVPVPAVPAVPAVPPIPPIPPIPAVPPVPIPDPAPEPVFVGQSQVTEPKAIQRMIATRTRRGTGALRVCYEAHEPDPEHAQNRWDISFVVQPDGGVGDIEIIPLDKTFPEIEACYRKALASWTYAPIPEPVAVQRTFTFRW